MVSRDDWVRADNAARIGRGRAPDLLKDTYVMLSGGPDVYEICTLEDVALRAHRGEASDGTRMAPLNFEVTSYGGRSQPGAYAWKLRTGPIQIPLCECGSVNAKEHDANGCEPVPIWWGTLAQS